MTHNNDDYQDYEGMKNLELADYIWPEGMGLLGNVRNLSPQAMLAVRDRIITLHQQVADYTRALTGTQEMIGLIMASVARIEHALSLIQLKNKQDQD